MVSLHPKRYSLPTLAENISRLFGFPLKYTMGFKIAAGESGCRFVAGPKVLSTSVAVLTILLGCAVVFLALWFKVLSSL